MGSPLSDSIYNLFKFSNMLGGHTHTSADDDTIVRLACEAVQNVMAQAFVCSNGEVLCFPPPICHELYVPPDTVGYRLLVQAGWNGRIGEINGVRRIAND